MITLNVQSIIDAWNRGEVAILGSTRDPDEVTRAWKASIGKLPGPGTVLRTSGSSAEPKSVWHTLNAHMANAKAVIHDADLKAGDKWALTLPMYHVGGLSVVVRCMMAGASVAMSIDEPGVTHMSIVPTQLRRMMQHAEQLKILQGMKRVYVGAAPISDQLLATARAQGIPLVATYGSTEMASQIATDSGVLPDREVMIASDGEIYVCGPMLMEGYVRNGEVDRARDENGWFHTGDIGEWVSPNRLQLRGRKDNMMISGGENIHPEEIERVLLEYPGVDDVVVVSRSSAEWGERPVAFVKMSSINDDQLRSFLREKLASFKVPDEFLPWPSELPTGMLKVPRAYFKERFSL